MFTKEEAKQTDTTQHATATATAPKPAPKKAAAPKPAAKKSAAATKPAAKAAAPKKTAPKKEKKESLLGNRVAPWRQPVIDAASQILRKADRVGTKEIREKLNETPAGKKITDGQIRIAMRGAAKQGAFRRVGAAEYRPGKAATH